MVTKKRNQVCDGVAPPEAVRGGGYEVVTPNVTGVTLGAEMHNAEPLQTDYSDYPVKSRVAFFRRTRCKARRLIRT